MKRDTMVGGVDGVGKSSFLGILKGCAKDLGTIVDEETSSVRLLDDCLEKGVSFAQESTARKAREYDPPVLHRSGSRSGAPLPH